jgi:hypothetical protein
MRDLNNLTEQDVKDIKAPGELDYGLTLEQALAMEVRYRQREWTLGELVDEEPGRLEYLMETAQPGTVLFSAVALVYNANLEKILLPADKHNRRIRAAGLKGLKKKKGKRKRLFLKPHVLAKI